MFASRCSRLAAVAFSIGFAALNSASANVIGSGSQNFNPTTNNLDFVTVESSRTLQPGVVALGIFVDDAVNSLPYIDSGTQGLTTFNDNLVGFDFNAGIGLLPAWDFGISFPSVLAQTVEATGPLHGQFSQTGMTEIRANSKYRLLGNDEKGIALVGSVNFNLTQNNPFSGIDPGPTWNLQLAADTTISWVRVAVNIGHRWFQPGTAVAGSPILPQGDQLIASAGASYLVPHTDTKAILEIFGSRPDSHVNDNTDRLSASLEILLGAKHDFANGIAFHAGVGAGLIHGISSPDYRVYTGLTYEIGPLFAKNTSFEVVKEEDHQRLITQNIQFDFDSDRLNEKGKEALDEVVKYLRHQDFKTIAIEGHTDSVGSEKYNLSLSQRRADAIKKHLIEHDSFKEKQLEAIGYGPSRPIADNGNFQGRQMNRRVEFRIEK